MSESEAGNDLSSLTDTERKKLVEQIYITFPRLNQVRSEIEHCHRYSKIAAEPECLLITGQQGAGKTTLRLSYARQHPRQLRREGVSVPVLDASIPVPATVKSLVTQLLAALGDPVPERGTIVTQTRRLKKLMHACKVELVVLDEFQHFIDRDSNVVLITLSNWLKDLLNETGTPMVLIGMPYADVILRANSQLERRFAMRASLDPFGWDGAEKQDEFRLFLSYLDSRLPLAKRSHLADPERALRIYCACDGIIGYLMKLVRRSAEMAIDLKMECIEDDLLAIAYDERLRARDPGRGNPFRVRIANLDPMQKRTPESFPFGGKRHADVRAKDLLL